MCKFVGQNCDMKRVVIFNVLLLTGMFFLNVAFTQNTKDLSICLQRVVDLSALKEVYTESEKSGETPIIIIRKDPIPDNLILFKFGKRVKILTFEEIATFKQFYQGSLDSYFDLDVTQATPDKMIVKGYFRKQNPVKLEVTLVRENDTWVVDKSKVN